MGTLFVIAYRNILRHKRRTFTSAFTIAFGLLYLIFMDSVFDGMDKAATDNMIRLSTSSIKVHNHQYYLEKESFPLQYGITNQDEIVDLVTKNPEVIGITPRVEFLGELSNYSDSKPIIGKVIKAEQDTTVFRLVDFIEGSFFSSNNENEIILGKELAEDLAVTVGDNITLYALTRYESRNADDFTIVGILNTTDPALNKSTVLITFQAANIFLDLENLVTELNIGIKRKLDFHQELAIMNQVKQSLNESFSGLYIETFQEMAADFLNMAKQKQVWGYVFIMVILLIAAVGIFNTVLMSVYERIREIGVLRAHGLDTFHLTILFAFEGTITGFLGSTLGIIFGCLGNLYLVTKGYPMDKMAGDIDVTGFPYWGTIYGQWNVEIIIAAFLFGIIVSTLAAIIPARKAAKMEITQVLRFA